MGVESDQQKKTGTLAAIYSPSQSLKSQLYDLKNAHGGLNPLLAEAPSLQGTLPHVGTFPLTKADLRHVHTPGLMCARFETNYTP